MRGGASTSQNANHEARASGKVIGKGAATKLDIESDYKVQLVVPGRNDASTLISITGPDNHAVECARARIMVCAAHGAGSGGRG